MFAVLFVALALPGSFAEDKLFVNPGNELFQYFVPLFEYYDRENFNHYYDTKSRRDKANEYVRILGTVVPPKTDITIPCDWVGIYSAPDTSRNNTWILPSYKDDPLDVKFIPIEHLPYANETRFNTDMYMDSFTTRPLFDKPLTLSTRDYTYVW